MAKIQIKSEKHTLLEKYFRVVEQFDSTLSSVIYSTIGLRCIIHWDTLTDTPSSAATPFEKNKHFEVSRWLLLKDFDIAESISQACDIVIQFLYTAIL